MRLSSDEWPSVIISSGQGVELTIDSNGTLEQGKMTLTDRFFGADPSPLSVLALLKRIASDESVSYVVLKF